MRCETKMHADHCLDGMNKARSRQKVQLSLMRTAQMLICGAAVGCVAVYTSLADALPKLSVSRTNAALKLSWPGTRIAADGSAVRPYFELQRSPDLRLWQPIGERH